jgi:tetratricopeptide (TPR) repeat protein
MKKRRYFCLAAVVMLMCLPCLCASAQTDRKEVRSGNRDFRKGDFREAEIDYMKALVKDSLSFAANYNLASTLYRQEEYGKARESLEKVSAAAPLSGHGADLYFNLGDVAIAQKDWKSAAEAFMQSLLLNPDDLQAKENFIYARKMLENQQQGGNGQNDKDNDKNDGRDDKGDGQNDQNKSDQEQDDKNQDEGDGQDKPNDDGQDGKDRDGRDKNDGQKQSQLSPQAAQQMLQAIQAKEKETQDKVQKAKAAAARSRQKEKNW